MKKSDSPVVVEERFEISIEKLWSAITERQQMILWFFEDIPEFKPVPGFETGFNVVSGESEFYHQWKIIDAVAPRKVRYNWKYRDYPGDSNVSFELFKEGKHTKLKLTHTVLSDFPENIPEFSRGGGGGGGGGRAAWQDGSILFPED